MNYRKGFFLIDALVASALLIGGAAVSSPLLKGINDNSELAVLTSDIASVMSAVDRRIFLDGYFDGDWGQSTQDLHGVKELLDYSFIGIENTDCSSGGSWVPRSFDNAHLRLIDCGVFPAHEAPLGLDFRGVEVSLGVDGRILEWRMEFGFTPDAWVSATNPVNTLVSVTSSMDRENLLPVTGGVEFGLGISGQDELLGIADCQLLSHRCVAVAKFTSGVMSIESPIYIPSVGGTFRGALSFDAQSGAPECYQGGEGVACGVTEDGDAHTGVASPTDLSLSGTAGACFDPRLGSSVSCGVRLVDYGSGKVSASTTEYLEVYGDLSVALHSGGEPLMGYHDGVWSVATDINQSMGVLDISRRSPIFHGDAEMSLLKYGRVATFGEEVSVAGWEGEFELVLRGNIEPGGECENRSVASDDGNNLYMCVGGQWVSGGGDELPSGAVVPMFANVCESGWSVLDTSRVGYRIEGPSRAVGSFTERTMYQQLTADHMIEHNHRTIVNTTSLGSNSSSGPKLLQGNSSLTSYTGAGQRLSMVPRAYAVEFCIKD